jgi:glutamate--cysteine ligase
VGAEFERFAVERGTGRPITFAESNGLESLLKKLADGFGWEPHEENGHVTTLSRDGATVSLEPGGQVEFSTPPRETIHDIVRDYEGHCREVAEVAPDRDFLSAGVHPTAAVDAIPLGPRPRHAVMAAYLPARSPRALAMMKATASIQVAFDYESEADAVRKFTVALKFAPLVNAMWANSSVAAGKLATHYSERAAVWQGMDPARSGLLTGLLKEGLSFETWTRYLLDVPRLFHVHDGRYEPANGTTFREWMVRGIRGVYPTLGDWDVHLTTVFPEARLKHFLEVRGADANPAPMAFAIPAFWKGLFYHAPTLSLAVAFADDLRPDDLNRLWKDVAEIGPAATVNGETVAAWNRRIVRLARAGLEAQGQGEEAFLDPLGG